MRTRALVCGEFRTCPIRKCLWKRSTPIFRHLTQSILCREVYRTAIVTFVAPQHIQLVNEADVLWNRGLGSGRFCVLPQRDD